MPVPEVTEEVLEKLRVENQKKRDQLQAARAARLANEQKVALEINQAQLQAEGEALDAALASEREMGKLTHVRASSADLDSIKQQMTSSVIGGTETSEKGAK
jgi:hypothetical protein